MAGQSRTIERSAAIDCKAIHVTDAKRLDLELVWIRHQPRFELVRILTQHGGLAKIEIDLGIAGPAAIGLREIPGKGGRRIEIEAICRNVRGQSRTAPGGEKSRA